MVATPFLHNLYHLPIYITDNKISGVLSVENITGVKSRFFWRRDIFIYATECPVIIYLNMKLELALVAIYTVKTSGDS